MDEVENSSSGKDPDNSSDALELEGGKELLNPPVHVSSSTSSATIGPEAETRCGYGNYRPKWLQGMNSPTVLVAFVALYAFLLGFVVNGINNINWSSLERQFDLTSTKTGYLVSVYEVSAAMFGVIIGYIGSGKQKAKLFAIGITISATGSFCMSSPHFIAGVYQKTEGVKSHDMCTRSSVIASLQEVCEEKGHYWYIFALGQFMHGFGGTSLFTIGATLIDDSVPPSKTPLCLGIVYGCVIMGAGVGYLVGGLFLDMYVDFDTVDNVHLKSNDVQWVGAWWLGLIIAGFLQLLIAVPISLFGHELPSAKEIRHNRYCLAPARVESELKIVGDSESSVSDRKYFFRVFLMLLRNPCFVFVTFAMATEALFLAAASSFMPKVVQTAFQVEAGTAAIYSGTAIVPSAVAGIFLGGWITKRFKLTIQGSLKFVVITAIAGAFGTCVLWINCDAGDTFGVSQPYEGSGVTDQKINLEHHCNQACNCTTDVYKPVCSKESGIYFSPCFAGCSHSIDNKYTNCQCVQQLGANISTTLFDTEDCRKPCSKITLFVCVLFVSMCVSFLPYAPTDNIQLRCVEEEYKVFAQGIKMMVIRILGSFPGPVLMGQVIDRACKIWRVNCGNNSSCWIFDHNNLIRNVFILSVGCKILVVLFCTLAYKLYTPPKTLIKSRSSRRSSKTSANTRMNQSKQYVKSQEEETALDAISKPMTDSPPEIMEGEESLSIHNSRNTSKTNSKYNSQNASKNNSKNNSENNSPEHQIQI